MPLIKSANSSSAIINTKSSPTKSFYQPSSSSAVVVKHSNETHFMKRYQNNNDDDDDDDYVNIDDDENGISGKPTITPTTAAKTTMGFSSITSANNKLNQCFKLTPSSNKNLILNDKESFSIGNADKEEKEENDFNIHHNISNKKSSSSSTGNKSCSTTPTASISGLAYNPITNSIKQLPNAIFSPQFNENLATLNRKWTKFNRRSHRRRNSSSGDSKELDKLVLKSMEWDDNDIY